MMKTYSELIKMDSFKDRYDYLRLGDRVGEQTFGYERYLNQTFYNSPEWKRLRNKIIVRDNGCDMGLEGHEIHGKIYIHHMNPIDPQSIMHRDPDILNPEYLICVSFETHQAIHYGIYDMLRQEPVERRPNDTKLW